MIQFDLLVREYISETFKTLSSMASKFNPGYNDR